MAKRTITGPLVVEASDDGKFHISYTPDTTQVLQAGTEYELILESIIVKGSKLAPTKDEGGLR